MFVNRSQKAFCLWLALVSTLLAGVLAAGQIRPVKAEPDIVLWIVTTTDPGPGYYGGYHAIVSGLQTSLADIGIDLRWQMYDIFDWEDQIWDDPTWYRNGTYNADDTTHTYGVDGWDLAIFEWWMNPTSYIWGDEIVYSWGTPDTGWNIMSWNDTKADYLFQKAQTTLDPTAHNRYMWLWQEEAMHNPPNVPIYYGEQYGAHASYLDNWDHVSWLYDLSQLDINEALFDTVAPTSPFDRKAAGSDKVMWGASEPIWDCTPTATLTYTEETINVLKQGMLYRTSRENLAYPPSGDYTLIPTLASDFPTWYQKPDGRWVAQVPLRSGVHWTNGVEFNASDVAYTYQAILTPATQAETYGDYSYLLDDVVVNSTYVVDFIYKDGMGPDYDFAGYQAHGWALGMLPFDQLGGTLPPDWSYGGINGSDPIPASMPGGNGLECLGPYVPYAYTPNIALEFQLNSDYVSALGFSPTMPNEFILKLIEEDTTRFNALKNLECDFIDYPIASVGTWNTMSGLPTHRLHTFLYPAAHTLWFQNNSTILANRYVRLAIAHAIDYDTIINNILQNWGVVNGIRGKTFVVQPFHDSYHPTLGYYEYNITKAQHYMDMYLDSLYETPKQSNNVNWVNGTLGDHDLSGFVEMPDYPIWVKNTGKYANGSAWDGPTVVPFYPSNPFDPDGDNNGFVELDDLTIWADHVGDRYPPEIPDPW